MKIKVCGMKYSENIDAVAGLNPDFMGFIFYEKSPRYVSDCPSAIRSLPIGIRKTGVFVNKSIADIQVIADDFALNVVQLHGNEKPVDCLLLKNAGWTVIKTISISQHADLQMTERYTACCDFFIFDTKTSAYGGSGCQFDWNILQEYRGDTPFFLSGGIGMHDAESIRRFRHPSFYGVDLNSRFETAPALKDIRLLTDFFACMR